MPAVCFVDGLHHEREFQRGVSGEPFFQICLTGGRHLVHERVADAYIEALVRKAKGLVAGDPFDEEAIALANATDYGLAAAVVSADFVRAQ